jgi:hemolysin activation/secretion protein
LDQSRLSLAVALLVGGLTAGMCLAQAAGSPTPASGSPAPVILTIGRFVIENEEPSLARRTQRLLSPLRAHPVSLETVRAAAERLEKLYVDQGYFLTHVELPPQEVPAYGEFRIRIVPGFIERIDAQGVPQALRARVLAFLLPLVGQRGITSARYERAVLLANDLPTADLKATLQAGAVAGGVILVVNGHYRPISGYVALDDFLPSVLGRTSATVSSAYNPTQYVDQIYATVSAAVDVDPLLSDSPHRYLETGMRAGLGTSGAELDLHYLWAMTNPPLREGGSDFGNVFLDTAGAFRRIAIRIAYPLVKMSATTLKLDAGFDATAEFQLANPFANSLYSDHVRVLRLGVDARHRFGTSTELAFGIDLSQGIDAFGSRGAGQASATVPLSQPGASDVFTKWEWNGSLRRDLPHDFEFALTARGQYVAAQPLLLAEKFVLGGPNDLSAYDFADFNGDRGWVARVELQRLSSWRHGDAQGAVQPYGFAARGEVVNLQPLEFVHPTEIGNSIGVGLRGSLGRSGLRTGPLELSAEMARQLNPDSDRLPNRWRANLAATWRY